MTSIQTLTRRALVIAFSAVALAACGALKPDPALTLKAEEAYVMLAAERYEDLFKLFAPKYQSATLAQEMPKMHRAVPPGAAAGPPVLAGWESSNSTDGNRRIVTFVYTYPELGAFVTVKTQFTGSDKDGWTIEGMNLEPKSGAYVESINLGKGTITPPPRGDITVAEVKAQRDEP
jgi:hypothetical protein